MSSKTQMQKAGEGGRKGKQKLNIIYKVKSKNQYKVQPKAKYKLVQTQGS